MTQRILIAALSLSLLVMPAPVLAQTTTPGGSARPDDLPALGLGLIEQLCASGISDEAALAACLSGVGAILSGQDPRALPGPEPSAAPQDLLERARDAVDDALASAGQVDLQSAIDDALAAVGAIDPTAAVDEALATARDIDVQAALDEAVGAVGEVDLEAALDEAVGAVGEVDLEAAVADVLARAQRIDLQAAIDRALEDAAAAGGSVDVSVLLEDSIASTREVVAAAQSWLEEHADVVCSGSSLSVGTAAAAVVVYLTASPGMALTAFEQVNGFGRQVCADVSS